METQSNNASFFTVAAEVCRRVMAVTAEKSSEQDDTKAWKWKGFPISLLL